MITKKDVQYVADLSRIHLREDEAEQLTKDLENILGYIQTLESIDTSEVKPTSHVLELKNVYREDTVKASLGQKKALEFSVEQHNGSFKVPKVIE